MSSICFFVPTIFFEEIDFGSINSKANEHERKYIMQIYNMILGGGALETKLAQNLRY